MAATRKLKAQTKRRGVRPVKQMPLPLGPSAPKELLLLDEVTARTRLSYTTLWRLEKAARFPKHVKIGFRRIAWRAADIDAWIAGDAAAVAA